MILGFIMVTLVALFFPVIFCQPVFTDEFEGNYIPEFLKQLEKNKCQNGGIRQL